MRVKEKEYCGTCGILLRQGLFGKNWVEFREKKLCKGCDEDRLEKVYEEKRKAREKLMEVPKIDKDLIYEPKEVK